MDEVLCELESDKATFELPAEASGTLHIVAEAGTTLPIGGLVATITVGAGSAVAAAAPVASTPAPAASAPVESSSSYAAGHASPAAAKALAEKGIDPATVQGSGVGGRITSPTAHREAETAKAHRG